MIENIIINVPISPIEANYLVRNNKFRAFKSIPSGKKTTELSLKGIREISVWFNWGAMMSQSLIDPTCSLTAIIDSKVINEKGFDYIQKEIGAYLPKVSEDVENLRRLVKLEWKVEESEEIEFDNNYHKDTTDRGSKKVLPKDLNKYKGSVSLEIELKQSKEKETELEKEIEYIHHTVSNNRLRITIKARKKKISRICEDFNLNGRNVETFLEMKDSIDERMLEYYISHITGSGDFYKFKDAEEEIMKSEFTKKEKEKMLDVLSAVGSYKGISNYLNHVEDAEPRSKSMKSVRKRQYALTVLKNIQKCGINPLTISVRTEIVSKKLDNIISIYKRDCKSVDDKSKVILIKPTSM